MPSPEGTRSSLFLKLNSDSDVVRELAWDELYRRYHPTILRFATQQGMPHGQAEDVAQEVMLRFYSTASKFEYDPAKGRFRGYLKTCVCRTVNRLRRKNKVRFVAGDELNAAAATVDRVWDELWEQRVMEEAVSSLERDQSRQSSNIFKQCVLDGATPQAVAASLGLTVDADYKSRQRSVASFKKILADLTADELFC